MVTEVIMFLASDGSVHATYAIAEQHEQDIRIARMAGAFAGAMGIVDQTLPQSIINNRVIEAFNNRNTRNLIKDLLSATLTPANE